MKKTRRSMWFSLSCGWKWMVICKAHRTEKGHTEHGNIVNGACAYLDYLLFFIQFFILVRITGLNDCLYRQVQTKIKSIYRCLWNTSVQDMAAVANKLFLSASLPKYTLAPFQSPFLSFPVVLQDESSVSSEEFDMSDPTWISTEHHSARSDLHPAANIERMLSPQNTHKEDDGKSSDFLAHTRFHS